MEKLKVSYLFEQPDVSSFDHKYQMKFTGVTVVKGPGEFMGKQYPHALDMSSDGKGSVSLTGLIPDRRRFCVRIIFKSTGPVQQKQNLTESDYLPFALFLEQGKTTGNFYLRGMVGNDKHGWAGPGTHFKKLLKTGTWYSVVLAYDLDTAALFVNDEIVAVHAFPSGNLTNRNDGKLYFGTWTDGKRDHFNGCLSAFEWYDGLSNDLKSVIDDQRSQPEWAITYKYEMVKSKIALGAQISAPIYNAVTGGHEQKYTTGTIIYHDSLGAAFEMHGGIYQFYKNWNKRNDLGYLVSDELVAANTSGRKSVFRKGAIYWSGATEAIPVLGQIYIDYEAMGESAAIGFPTGLVRKVGNGSEQVFQRARMYHKNGAPSAHEVHGGILDKFLALGGVTKWGFPLCNESDVVDKNKTVIGKFSDFESCTIYWSGATGAWEVHGSIRQKYQEIFGPLSELGFPTGDERNIPGVSGAGRMNTFKNGSILWYGSYSSIVIALPFNIRIGRLNTKESEGFGRGQNDLYTRITAKENSSEVYNKRHPSSGAWGNNNIKDINYTIPHNFVPNNPNMSAWFQLKAWDDDSPTNANDYLGLVSKTLNAANAWGYKLNNGAFTLGPSSKINSLTCGIIPQINVAKLSEPEKFWGCSNRGTPTIPWSTHAEAFRDVDSETEWWDVTDWIDKAFYELVTKDIAANGNCFGMSLEAIYARKFRSIFGLPLNRFTNWAGIVHEINVKHCYQAGAETIYWFLGQFLSGNTHDPKDIFNRTRNEFNAGNNPVLCIAQNYDFSGAPHCILPVGWDTSSKPWEMTVLDPKCPNTTKTLTVDPDNNTFKYMGYHGGEWSGGRMHYIPFSVLDHVPRTPTWDLILLIIAGTIILVGDDAITSSMVDENGKDLNGFGTRATEELKNGRQLEEFFYGYNGFDRPHRGGLGDILLRKESTVVAAAAAGTGRIIQMPVLDVLASSRLRSLAASLQNDKKTNKILAGRTVQSALADPVVTASVSADVLNAMKGMAAANANRNFRHGIEGLRDGKLQYLLKHQLSELRIETDLKAKEKHRFSVSEVGTSKLAIKIDSSRDKVAMLKMTNKLGVKDDNVTFSLSGLPLKAAKELQINPRPGLGGVEVIGVPPNINVDVSLDAMIDGKKVVRKFRMPFEGGARIPLASLLNENELAYSKIDNLFGPPLESRIIKGS